MHKGHIEFIKNKTDVHPNTGESKDKTIIDVYFYDDRVEFWGWGWIDTVKYGADTYADIYKAWDYILYTMTNCKNYDYCITKEVKMPYEAYAR